LVIYLQDFKDARYHEHKKLLKHVTEEKVKKI